MDNKVPEAQDLNAAAETPSGNKPSSAFGEEPETLKIGGVDVEDAMFLAKRRLQNFLDKIQFFPGRRWMAFTFMLVFFLFRMYVQRGYAVIAYLLGLFYLNNIMLFLAPAEDPEELAFRGGCSDTETVLPTRTEDEPSEYKGFQRKLQEMDFWCEMMGATTMAAFFSCF